MMPLTRIIQRRLATVLLISISAIALPPGAHSQGISMTSATATPAAGEGNTFAGLARASRKQIPLPWKIAIVLGAIVVASVVSWIALRVWRSANLFDREYRFPVAATAALRLGATRSGGHMATISFGARDGPNDAA